MLPEMSPRRPYLLRAFYDWLVDNQLTPHLVVDVTLVGVQVPMEFAQDGQIILNLAPRAVGNLELGNDEVRFNARFGGVPRQVRVPLYAVMAIYARENGAGTMFESEPAYEQPAASALTPVEESSAAALNPVNPSTVTENGDEEPGPEDEPPRPPRGRPALRVVK